MRTVDLVKTLAEIHRYIVFGLKPRWELYCKLADISITRMPHIL